MVGMAMAAMPWLAMADHAWHGCMAWLHGMAWWAMAERMGRIPHAERVASHPPSMLISQHTHFPGGA